MPIKGAEFNWDAIPSQWKSGTNPAANTECSDSVPTGKKWLLLGMQYQLVCDANAANRTVTLSLIHASGGRTMRIFAFGTLTATQTGDMAVFSDAVADTAGTWQQLNLGASVELPAGTVLSTVTTNRQVGDDFASPILHIKEAPV